MKQLIADGYLGQLRECRYAFTANLPIRGPLSWRQDATLSGFNMLTLGIFHEH